MSIINIDIYSKMYMTLNLINYSMNNMEKRVQMTSDFFAYVYDTGREDFQIYEIFSSIISSLKELRIKHPVYFYHGEITGTCKIFDLEPYINRNSMCTIIGKPRFTDWPLFICLHGISIEERDFIEKSLQKNKSYIGSTNVELETTVDTKKIWKHMANFLKVENNTVYFVDDYSGEPNFIEKTFKNNNYNIKYLVDIENSIDDKNISSKNHFLVQNYFQLGIKLNVEVRVAGGLIWDSIEKLFNINYFPKYMFQEAEPNNAEDCYMCIYNASQGIERLQKVLIELFLSRDNCDLDREEKIYDLLMSHNHVELNREIMNKLSKKETKYGKLMNDLMLFYNKIRYHNYNIDKEYNRTYFYDILCSYADGNKNMGDSISIKELESFKNNFGRILGDYSLFLYTY